MHQQNQRGLKPRLNQIWSKVGSGLENRKMIRVGSPNLISFVSPLPVHFVTFTFVTLWEVMGRGPIGASWGSKNGPVRATLR